MFETCLVFLCYVKKFFLFVVMNKNWFILPQLHFHRQQTMLGMQKMLKWTARCQFHQHFTRTFFVRMCLAQLFSSNVLALAKVQNHFCTKNARVKCWWNWPQLSLVTFQDFVQKTAHKMLMKLPPVH